MTDESIDHYYDLYNEERQKEKTYGLKHLRQNKTNGQGTKSSWRTTNGNRQRVSASPQSADHLATIHRAFRVPQMANK